MRRTIGLYETAPNAANFIEDLGPLGQGKSFAGSMYTDLWIIFLRLLQVPAPVEILHASGSRYPAYLLWDSFAQTMLGRNST